MAGRGVAVVPVEISAQHRQGHHRTSEIVGQAFALRPSAGKDLHVGEQDLGGQLRPLPGQQGHRHQTPSNHRLMVTARSIRSPLWCPRVSACSSSGPGATPRCASAGDTTPAPVSPPGSTSPPRWSTGRPDALGGLLLRQVQARASFVKSLFPPATRAARLPLLARLLPLGCPPRRTAPHLDLHPRLRPRRPHPLDSLGNSLPKRRLCCARTSWIHRPQPALLDKQFLPVHHRPGHPLQFRGNLAHSRSALPPRCLRRVLVEAPPAAPPPHPHQRRAHVQPQRPRCLSGSCGSVPVMGTPHDRRSSGPFRPAGTAPAPGAAPGCSPASALSPPAVDHPVIAHHHRLVRLRRLENDAIGASAAPMRSAPAAGSAVASPGAPPNSVGAIPPGPAPPRPAPGSPRAASPLPEDIGIDRDLHPRPQTGVPPSPPPGPSWSPSDSCPPAPPHPQRSPPAPAGSRSAAGVLPQPPQNHPQRLRGQVRHTTPSRIRNRLIPTTRCNLPAHPPVDATGRSDSSTVPPHAAPPLADAPGPSAHSTDAAPPPPSPEPASEPPPPAPAPPPPAGPLPPDPEAPSPLPC